jgi:hypothetical protein
MMGFLGREWRFVAVFGGENSKKRAKRAAFKAPF